MAIYVELPAKLAAMAGIEKAELHGGSMTLYDALNQLVDQYPVLKLELFELGEPDWAYFYSVNGDAIPQEQFFATILNDGDQVSLLGLPVLGGG